MGKIQRLLLSFLRSIYFAGLKRDNFCVKNIKSNLKSLIEKQKKNFL
jgi:hypothetical protein